MACLLLWATATSSLLAQEYDTASADALLEKLIAATSVDSHLRIKQLEEKLATDLTVEQKSETLKELIFLTIDNSNIESLQKYSKLGQETARITGDEELKIYADLGFATITQIENQFTEAQKQIDAVKTYAQSHGNDESLFFVETAEAMLSVSLGDYLSGLEKLSRSVNTLPDNKRGNWMRLTAYTSLAFIFMDVNDLDQVINYYLLALELAQRENIAFDRETVLHNMIISLQYMKLYDLAERYTAGLEAITKQIDRPDGLYYVYYNLALIRYHQDRFSETIGYVEKALTYPDDPYFDAELYDLAAISEAQLGNPDIAQEYLDKSQALFATMDLGLDTSSFANLTKAHIMRARGNLSEAFDALNNVRRKQLDDQFEGFTNSVTDFQTSLNSVYERQKAELELVAAQRANTRLIVVFAFVFIVTLSGILVMQYRHNKQLDRSRIDAERANRAKSEFLANMSHELRTPLNAILGFSEMMTHKVFGELGSKQYEDYAEHIHQSGGLLLDIINDILDLSKIESGQVKLAEEVIDLGLLFEDSRILLNNRARFKQINIEIKPLDDAPILFADKRLVKQILLNLLSNAIKFTPAGGTVILSAKRTPKGKLAITVKDNGQGMTQDELALALVPFGQAGTTLTRSHEGTGLGLPLTKTLVELHDGELDVDTEKGVGTAVTVTFPKERCINQNNIPSKEERHIEVNTKALKI